MKTKLLLILTIVSLYSYQVQAQFLWYENQSNTADIIQAGTLQGTFTNNETNPNTGGVNTNATCSKFVRSGVNNPQVLFDLTNPITSLSGFSISLKAYIDQATGSFTTTNKRLRVYLRNIGQGATGQLWLADDMVNGQVWEQKNFNFDGTAIPQNIIDAGGFDRIAILLAAGDTAGETTTYYFDTIEGSTNQGAPAEAVLESGNVWYHNYSPDTFMASAGEILLGTLDSDVASPNTTQNSSALVSRFTKAEGDNSLIKFDLPGGIDNIADALLKIRIYTVANSTSSNNNLKILLRQDGVGATQLGLVANVTAFDKWVDYTFDFTSLSFNGVTYYNEAWIAFAQPDAEPFDATGNIYYIDAFQGPTGNPALSVDEVDFKKNNLRLFPTRVNDHFSINIDVRSAEVYNMLGQIVKDYKSQKDFNVSNLSSGLYVFRAQLNDGSIQLARFVKK